jgi:hypothetical protein
MNNPKSLKLIIAVLTIALFASLGFIRYAMLQIDEWKNQLRGEAQVRGLQAAESDYQAGKHRLYVIAGISDQIKYSGTNDGPYEIWNPPWEPEPYTVRFVIETKWAAYNEHMRNMVEHHWEILPATNIPAPKSRQ